MKIDPNRTWKKVEERLKTEADPVLRANLETVLAHMKAEALGDLDGLMATITKGQPAYHAYGTDDPLMNPSTREQVREFYTAFVASGAVKLELDVDRLVVDRDVVVTEGIMRMAYPGATLEFMGHDVDDAEAFYLYETRMCILWPMDDDALVIGEDSYTGWDGFEGIATRKLAAEDMGEAII